MGPSRSGDSHLGDLAGFYSGASCVVTGGLGFIGSNLVRALDQAGARVTVIDSLEPRHGGRADNLEGVEAEVVIADIGDAQAVAGPLGGADYVFNLAGQVSHLDSMEDPLRDLDLNTRSHLAFLELIRRAGTAVPVVYSSTRQVYGPTRSLPVDETHPVDPIDVNGVSKLATEQLHLIYHRVHGIPATALRLSNVYGPGQRLEGDHQGVLPVFLRRALHGEPVIVYGDGEQRRDCLHVDDAVAAILLAGARPAAVGAVLNIGHHEAFSLLEIAETIVAAVGGGEIVTVPWPPERERISIGSYATDYGRATELLGWRPRIDLREGIEATVAFARPRIPRPG